MDVAALKFFRTLVSLQDTFYLAQLTHNNIFGLILDIVLETMPRDNLLNSACLELFEYIKRDNIKPIITHVVEKYREKMMAITYVDIFEKLIQRYDELQGYALEADTTLFSQEEISPAQRGVINGQRWQGVREMDAAEEEYFNASDDEEEVCISEDTLQTSANDILNVQWPSDARQDGLAVVNQETSHVKLVDYPDDDEDDAGDLMDAKAESMGVEKQEIELLERRIADTSSVGPRLAQAPPEKISEKRRRDEDDQDELGRLAQNGPKRRSSSASSNASMYLRRRRSSVDRGMKNSANNEISNAATNTGPKKIAINLSSALKSHVTVEAEAIQLREPDEETANGDKTESATESEVSSHSS